jgi:ABC-type sulfate/molybdate transport systems ATPase subunit
VLTTWSLRLIDYNYQQAANAVVLMIALISWAGTVMIQKITGTGLAEAWRNKMPTIHLTHLTKPIRAAIPGGKQYQPDGERREFMCLLGPSGCGKTTILRMIAGIEHASGGEITSAIRSLTQSHGIYVPPEKRGIGLVFQSYALWPHMTVEQNVDFGLRLQNRR